MTKVYYDGLCHLCSREIDHYRKARGADRIQFVDITSLAFDAKIEGLDPMAVHKVMHVKAVDGSIKTELDAFIEIWRTLPGYQWLAKFVQIQPIRAVADRAYSAFAVIRPYLPRRKASDCSDSPYCDVNTGK